jgi:glycine/D-amino acid oxidase-like deaminating enzyme
MPQTEGYHVIVIGAGLSGAALARRVAEQDRRVVVLEATEAPGGTLKRAPGLAFLGTPFPKIPYSADYDLADSLALWKLSYENLHLLESELKSAGLPLRSVGSQRLAMTAPEAEAFQESTMHLKENGYTVAYEETESTLEALSAQGDAFRYVGAMKTLDDIRFESEPLIRHLLNHENITVESDTEAYAIKPRADLGLTVWAHDHYLWADKIVIANGVHAARLNPTFAERLEFAHVHTIALRQMPELPAPLVLNHGRILALNDSDEDAGYLIAHGPEGVDLLRMLTPLAEQLCPDAVVTDRFSSRVADSTEPVPWIGAHPDQPQLYALIGLGVYGASWAFVAAQQLAEMILDDQAPPLQPLNRAVTL